MIAGAGGELFKEADLLLDFAQQQTSAVGGNLAAIEAGDKFAGAEVLERQRLELTECRDPNAPPVVTIFLLPQAFTTRRTFGLYPLVRNAG
jgi:hypothetical protein